MAASFPALGHNPLQLHCPLDSQIYTLDSLARADTATILSWARSLPLDGPKKAGKGEAERTGRKLMVGRSHFPPVHSTIDFLHHGDPIAGRLIIGMAEYGLCRSDITAVARNRSGLTRAPCPSLDRH